MPPSSLISQAFIKLHNIHVVAHGEEYLPENMRAGTMDYYAIPRVMGLCRALPRTPGISTSDLMNRIKDRVLSRSDEIAEVQSNEVQSKK
jgi:hypothetical protein